MIHFPIILPQINPNLISYGHFVIRYYSLAYIISILAAWFLLWRFNKKTPLLSAEALDSWLSWAVLGIVFGGRIGYVLFYNLEYYLQNPLQIMAIWRGGMSFHGGLIGGTFSMFLFCKKYKIEFLKLMDLHAALVPIGLFLGRIANFINMELYGRPTGNNFGVIFPNVDNLPRHPSQLYEAGLEGLLLFLILFPLANIEKLRARSGLICGLFLILYNIERIFIEQFRQPDEQIGLLFNHSITMGQALSIPLLLLGLIVFCNSFLRKINLKE